MIKVDEEIDGNIYLDILLEEEDINALVDKQMVETDVSIGKGRLYIGIKYYEEGIHEKI
jgi:hypothetical protein